MNEALSRWIVVQPSALASSISCWTIARPTPSPRPVGPHEHPLDLAHGAAQQLEATDADRLAVDLGDVEPPSRLEHLVEHLRRMISLCRDDDPELDPDPLGSPIAEFTGERGRGRELVGRLDASKAYLVAGHGSEPIAGMRGPRDASCPP